MAENNSFNQENDFQNVKDEVSLKAFILKAKSQIDFLKTKWLVIVVVGLLGGTIGLANAYFKKPIYIATLSFALEDDKAGGGLSGALGLASQFGFDLGGSAGGAYAGDNLIELMKSRSVIEKTLLNPVIIKGKTTTLAQYYIEFTNMRKDWDKDPDLLAMYYMPTDQRANFTLKKDSLLGVIYENLKKDNVTVFQKDKKLSIVEISVEAKNELFAKYFAESLSEKISELYIETKSKKAMMNLSILEKQTDSIRGELNAAISGVAYANENTFNLNSALNSKRIPSTKKQVDVQANTVILTELVKNLELARVTLRKETPLIQIIDKPILPLKKKKFSKIMGIGIGSLIGGFLILLILLFKKWWRDQMLAS